MAEATTMPMTMALQADAPLPDDGPTGLRLRQLRAERRLSQIALSQALGLSLDYLRLLEQDHSPLTVSVVEKVKRTLQIDLRQDQA
jgi:transcriptional regulator with XRE-family HTH domain